VQGGKGGRGFRVKALGHGVYGLGFKVCGLGIGMYVFHGSEEKDGGYLYTITCFFRVSWGVGRGAVKGWCDEVFETPSP